MSGSIPYNLYPALDVDSVAISKFKAPASANSVIEALLVREGAVMLILKLSKTPSKSTIEKLGEVTSKDLTTEPLKYSSIILPLNTNFLSLLNTTLFLSSLYALSASAGIPDAILEAKSTIVSFNVPSLISLKNVGLTATGIYLPLEDSTNKKVLPLCSFSLLNDPTISSSVTFISAASFPI